jgi:hypothetical protein
MVAKAEDAMSRGGRVAEAPGEIARRPLANSAEPWGRIFPKAVEPPVESIADLNP